MDVVGVDVLADASFAAPSGVDAAAAAAASINAARDLPVVGVLVAVAAAPDLFGVDAAVAAAALVAAAEDDEDEEEAVEEAVAAGDVRDTTGEKASGVSRGVIGVGAGSDKDATHEEAVALALVPVPAALVMNLMKSTMVAAPALAA